MTRTAKYSEIESYFINSITSGQLKTGQQLPSEMELCSQFGVSRMTVNKAMTNLLNNGYIRRIPGNGSFVDDTYMTASQHFFHPHSISQDIESFGMVPGSDLLEYKVIRGRECPEAAAELKIADDDFVHYFVRLRTGDGKPFCISYTYIVYDLLPNLDVKCLESSFNEYLDSLGLKRSSGYTAFSATLPDEQQARLLGSDHVALLKQKIFWQYENRPFEITTHYFVNDRLSFFINRDRPIALSDTSPYSKVLS